MLTGVKPSVCVCVCRTEGQPLPEHQGVALKSLLSCQAAPRGSEGWRAPVAYLLHLGTSKLSSAPQLSLLVGLLCQQRAHPSSSSPAADRAACSFSTSAWLALSSPTTFPGWHAGGFGHQGEQGHPHHHWQKQAGSPWAPLARGKAKDLETSPAY